MKNEIEGYQGLKHKILPRGELSEILVDMCNARDGKKKAKFERLRNLVVTLHMRFALTLAKRTKGGMLEDRVQIAALGLIRACETFDPLKGAAFTTYAKHWVRAFVQGEDRKTGATIRQPAGSLKKLAKVRKASEKYKQHHGHYPDADEIVAATGLTVAQVRRALKQNTEEPDSLDRVIASNGHHHDVLLGDTIPDESPGADAILEDRERDALAKELLKGLRPRARAIISARLGLDDRGNGRTLREVGLEQGGLSRERIRQLQNKALNDMREKKR